MGSAVILLGWRDCFTNKLSAQALSDFTWHPASLCVTSSNERILVPNTWFSSLMSLTLIVHSVQKCIERCILSHSSLLSNCCEPGYVYLNKSRERFWEETNLIPHEYNILSHCIMIDRTPIRVQDNILLN